MTQTTLNRIALLTVAAVLGAPVAAEAKNGRGHGPASAPGQLKRTLEGPRPVAAFEEAAPVAEQPAEEAPVVALPSEDAAPVPAAPAEDEAAPPKGAAKAKKAKRAGKGHGRKVTFVLRGTIVEVDEEQGTVVVDVEGGNKRGRRFRGEEVTVDLSRAKVTDGEDAVAIDDLLEGDEVVVQAKLPRSTYAGDAGTIAARRLTVLVDDEVEEDEDEDVPVEASPLEPVADPEPQL